MTAMFEMLIGIPGSGKSTYVKKKIDVAYIVTGKQIGRAHV